MEEKSARRKEDWAKRQEEYRHRKVLSEHSHSIAHLPHHYEGEADRECPIPRKGSLESNRISRPERRIDVAIEEARQR